MECEHDPERTQGAGRKAEKKRLEEEQKRRAEEERIRKEERERIKEEERIRKEEREKAEQAAVNEAAQGFFAEEADDELPFEQPTTITAFYKVVATPEELEEVEMAFNSIGIYYTRRDA